MKRVLFSLLALALCLCACSHNKEAEPTLQDQSELLKESQMVDSTYAMTGEIDVLATVKLVNEAVDFAEKNPEDGASPELLAKAGGYCMRIASTSTDKDQRAKYSERALNIFDKIIKVYPNHPVVKYCFWWKGIIYEDILQMYPSAENEYREFLHRFPNDSLAVSIQYSLDHLGASNESLEKNSLQ